MYCYIVSESGTEFGKLYTVGFYKPSGAWVPESDHDDDESAARRVSFLNGGSGDSMGRLDPERV